jgi:DNA-binding CsgD family transcriptional regulator
VHDGLTRWRMLGDRCGIAECLALLDLLARRAHDLTRACALFEESLALRRNLADGWGVAEVLHELGELDLDQGQFARARARLEESLLGSHSRGDVASVARGLESFAALAGARSQPARALELAGAATALGERVHAGTSTDRYWLRLQRTRAAAAKMLGADSADAAFDSGRALTLDQSVQRARSTLQPAVTAVDSVQRAASQAGPLASLTQREQEVAALVLRGRSNRQIAEALVISERTAETHVCRILKKLNLDSRAELAGLFIDGGSSAPHAVVPSNTIVRRHLSRLPDRLSA